jgi:hypothetical protein
MQYAKGACEKIWGGGGVEGMVKEWKTPVVRTRTDLSK